MSIVTDAGLNRLIALISPDCTKIGVGTGSSPDYYDNLLGNETIRKSTINAIAGFGFTSKASFNETEANGNLTEVGLFCNGATGTINTGALLASFLTLITKNNTQSLNVTIDVLIKTNYNFCSGQLLCSDFLVM